MRPPPHPSDPLEMVPDALRDEVQRAWENFDVREALRSLQQEIFRVWAASPFVVRTCFQASDLLHDLFESGDLSRVYEAGEIAQRVHKIVDRVDNEKALMRVLRVLRRREWLRIAWRDLSGASQLDETLNELSTLAEHCVDRALAWCYQDACARFGEPRNSQGEPQRLVALGMGKLGGRELNFSSDIDLIFAYPDDGVTTGKRELENQAFFARLGTRLIKILSEYTADGFAFRVDMRLRPFGDAGPLAMSFDAMEHYYQTHGRDWERYALIKARVVAGDHEAGAVLLRNLRPFIYRRYLDYGAFPALREMKGLIDDEVKRRALCDNVKLGPGGIREIEFIAQAYQLVRGGRDPELQSRELQVVLPLLAQKGLLNDAEAKTLLTAYGFLRRIENRLQMANDQQTHELPNDERDQMRLAFAMGYSDWQQLKEDLDWHCRRVHEQFERTFAAPDPRDQALWATGVHAQLKKLWEERLEVRQAMELLTQCGFEDATRVWSALKALRGGHTYRAQSTTGRERLDRLMPRLIMAVGAGTTPDRTLTRILPIVEGIARRSVYLSLLNENPVVLSQLVKLSAASPWIADYLCRHPILLDELLDPRELYTPPDRAALALQLQEEFRQIDPLDMDVQMERLRIFKQANVLRVAAADVMDALPLMRVSDQLTWIAETILSHVLEIVRRQMVARYGRPRCRIDGRSYEPGFAIIAYGKLGGIELGYGSDLDLVFLHDSAGERQVTDGERPIDNAVFFVRLGQRIVHALTTLTPAGQLYEVDTRLRPSGAAGILVSGLRAFDYYQREKAWLWEHQALVRARPVVGSKRIGEKFQRIRAEVLARPRDGSALKRQVREMRERMWRDLSTHHADKFDLKRDPGGIADIEFMVQYSVLAWAGQHSAVTEFTDNIRILDALGASGLLPADDARFLQDTYRGFRDRVHALSLQGQDTVVKADEFRAERERVKRLWREMMQE